MSIKVSIAMATYNGAKYLQEQLDSLAQQDYLPCELIACDDGSSDDTLIILENFAKEAPFPVSTYRNESRLGFADNFLKAASLCRGDWVAFCDQDDVWLPNKLKDAVAAIEQYPSAVMIAQNSYICDEQLKHNGRTFPPGFHPPRSQYGFWVWPGFIKTFRRSILSNIIDLIQIQGRPKSYFQSNGLITHDKLTCLIANSTGGFVVLREPAALYRRHASALTGWYKPANIQERIKIASQVGADYYTYLSEVAKETAEFLRNIAAATDSNKAKDFLLAANDFDRISEIQKHRAALYSEQSAMQRFHHLLAAIVMGGYIGSKTVAMGGKSLIKDICQSFGLLDMIYKPSS